MESHVRRRGGLFWPIVFKGMDYLAILSAEFEALFLYRLLGHESYHVSDAALFIWVPLAMLIFLGPSDYRHMRPMLDCVRSTFRSVCCGVFTCIFALYAFKASLLAGRLYVALAGTIILVNIFILRFLVRVLLKKYHLLEEPIIIVGAGLTAERVLEFFNGDLGYRYRVIGLLDDYPEHVHDVIKHDFLLLGGFKEAEQIVRDSGVETVIITAPGIGNEKLAALIAAIQPHVKYLNYVPNLIGTPMSSISVDTLFSEKILMLKLRNNLARRGNRWAKRAFDLICTILGGLAISPILLILALMVAIENRGHVIFAHRRIGKDGRPFPCYKFQTMVSDADKRLAEYLEKNPEARKEWEENFKLTHDPRVTKLGAFLRKTSLDELPQLMNVLKGEMSLVGPRPIVAAEIEKYGENIREYYMVRPGITGMWQVSGRSDTTYEERVEMDTWYVRNWSVWLDLMYLAKTFTAVTKGKGAY